MSVGGGLVRLAVRVRASEADLVLARLLPLLSRGAEERAVGGAVEYALYGCAGELPDEAALRALVGDALLGVSTARVPDGWETAWHAHLGRVQAGGFAIRPPWVAGAPEDIVVEPGTTFGAGGHPTTGLCLELLAEAAGRTFSAAGGGAVGAAGTAAGGRVAAAGGGGMAPDAAAAGGGAVAPGAAAAGGEGGAAGALCDWGCGSGVLAIAAARLGFAPVAAVDVDPVAVALARENARANGAEVAAARLDLGRERPPWAPTVVANLTLGLLEAVAAAGRPRPRRLIASGVLAEQADAVATAWGMAERARREADGWAALLLEAA